MRRVTAVLALWIWPIICTAQPLDADPRSRYLEAIAQTAADAVTKGAWELKKCIENWSMLGVRLGVHRTIDEAGGRSVMLEVGGSTWARHESVRVDGFMLESSTRPGSQVGIEGSRLGEIVSSLYTGGDLDTLAGTAASAASDGECHFLTVADDGRSKTIAAYTLPEHGPTRMLIEEMLRAGRDDAHKPTPKVSRKATGAGGVR